MIPLPFNPNSYKPATYRRFTLWESWDQFSDLPSRYWVYYDNWITEIAKRPSMLEGQPKFRFDTIELTARQLYFQVIHSNVLLQEGNI